MMQLELHLITVTTDYIGISSESSKATTTYTRVSSAPTTSPKSADANPVAVAAGVVATAALLIAVLLICYYCIRRMKK